LCLCILSARFLIISSNNSILKCIITCVFLDFWVFGAHCLHCVLSASFVVIVLCPVLLFLVYRVYDSHRKIINNNNYVRDFLFFINVG